MPEDIEEMVNVTKISLTSFSYRLLSRENLTDFLNMSSFPSYYEQLVVQNKADYIRVRLIEKYGGIWVDASTFVNSGEAMDHFIGEAVDSKCDLISFSVDLHFASLNFFGAPEESLLMKMYRKRYDNLLTTKNPIESAVHLCHEVNEKLGIDNKCNFYETIDYIFFDLILKNPYLRKRIFLSKSPSHYSFIDIAHKELSYLLRCDEKA
jgi:hypothetical protein